MPRSTSAGRLLDEPLDVVTGRSRSQASNSRTLQITDNANFLKGNHTLSFGGTFRRTWWWFRRNDLLAGPLTALTATADDGSFITIPAQFRPPTCSAAVTTSCLLTADVTRWNRLYTSLTGMVDNIGLLSVRNGALEPQPPGTFLDVDTTQNGYEAYINDAWRLTSNLTLSVGANYQVYGSPSEKENRYAYLVDTATNEILGVDAYLDRAQDAANGGLPFNPTLGYLPLSDSGRDRFYDTDYSNFGPRVAVAWSPSFSSGIGKWLFGDSQGVLRGGYSLVFDRQNNVNLGSWQMGVAFGQTWSRQRAAMQSGRIAWSELLAVGDGSGRQLPGGRRWSGADASAAAADCADRASGAVRRYRDAACGSGAGKRPDAQL